MPILSDIVVNIGREHIARSTYVKFLGLLLDENLHWDFYPPELFKKLTGKCGIVFKIRDLLPTNTFVKVYNSILMSFCNLALVYGAKHLLHIFNHYLNSHVWGGAPKSSLNLLDRVQSKAIRLINNPNLTNSLQSLSHRRLVADLSIFYRYFHGHCSQEIKNIIPDPMRRV